MLSLLISVADYAFSKSAIHEIEAACMLVAAGVFLGFAVISAQLDDIYKVQNKPPHEIDKAA